MGSWRRDGRGESTDSGFRPRGEGRRDDGPAPGETSSRQRRNRPAPGSDVTPPGFDGSDGWRPAFEGERPAPGDTGSWRDSEGRTADRRSRQREPRRGLDAQRGVGVPARKDGARDYRRREPDTNWQRELETAAWDRDPETEVWLRDSDTGQWHRAEADDDEDDEDDRGDGTRPRRRRRAPESTDSPLAIEGNDPAERRGGGRRRAPEGPRQLSAAPEAPLDPVVYRREDDAGRTRETEDQPGAYASETPSRPVSSVPTRPVSAMPNRPVSAMPDRPMSAPPSPGQATPSGGPASGLNSSGGLASADGSASPGGRAGRGGPGDEANWRQDLIDPAAEARGQRADDATAAWLRELGGNRQQLGGTAPVSPDVSPQPTFGGRASVDPSSGGGWRPDAQAAAQAESWRSQLRAEQGEPAPSDAVTEIRPPADPGSWRQPGTPDPEAKGSANYREGGSADWRNELKAESNLAAGESRRFGTSDFVPFRAPSKDAASASVKVPAASSASAGATEVIPRTGPSWQDPPDTEWPPRGAVMTSPTGSYERRPVSTLTSASALQNDLLEPEDEVEEDTGGPLAAVGYTVVWYGVPVVLFVVYMLVLSGNQQTHALDTLAKAAPQFGLSLVLSMLVAVGLRWASGSWKAASVGLAAAVMGGGLATVLTSAITGQSLS